MQNYPETVWEAVMKGVFPLTIRGGEEEKRLKISFLHGMNSARSLLLQSTNLDNNNMIMFNNEFNNQIVASLARMGQRPGRVELKNLKLS